MHVLANFSIGVLNTNICSCFWARSNFNNFSWCNRCHWSASRHNNVYTIMLCFFSGFRVFSYTKFTADRSCCRRFHYHSICRHTSNWIVCGCILCIPSLLFLFSFSFASSHDCRSSFIARIIISRSWNCSTSR